MYERLGISFLPIKVMDNVAPILVATIALGVLLIMISILINIVSGVKNKDYESALFSNNGIAGLVFFGSILGGLVGTLLGVKVFSVPYVLLLIVLPLVLMFMREPLACMVKGKKYKMEGGVGDFIASNFFEVFEFLLSYVSNSLSFVRVGGFAISHASMMLVVMALAKGMSAAASPVMVVFGNVFVMGIEALLVCIQAMRLEFYELFSRFYSGDGVPFTPVKINYNCLEDFVMLIYFLIPAVVLGLLMLPIVSAIKKRKSGKSIKNAFMVNFCAFFGVMAICAVLPFGLNAYAANENDNASVTAEAEEAEDNGGTDGLMYIASALAVGLGAIGGGIAIAAAAPAAIGAVSEDPKSFSKALIFVALGEACALYGFIVALCMLFV